MKVVSVSLLILLIQILYGQGRQVNNVSENMGKLFNIIMSELKQKDDRINALEKKVGSKRNLAKSTEGTVNSNGEGDATVVIRALRKEIDTLQAIIRKGLQAEKRARLKAQKNVTKILDDFKTNMTRLTDNIDMRINSMKEEDKDIKKLIIRTKDELENASRTLETESVARVDEMYSYFKSKHSDFRKLLCDIDEYDACFAGDCCIKHQYIYRNYALGQTTFQSSLLGNGTSDKAVDGNRNCTSRYCGYSCTHTIFETDPWWMVDLGSVVSVARVIIKNRGDCCGERLKNIIITVALNKDQEGLECSRFLGPGYNDQLVEMHCPQRISGQFVRIKMNGAGYLTLCEVEVLTY